MPFSQSFGKHQSSSTFAIIVVVSFVTFLIGLGIGLGQGIQAKTDASQTKSGSSDWVASRSLFGSSSKEVTLPEGVDFDLYWRVWRDLKAQYHKKELDDKTLFYGSIQGMANAVGDPYTTFFEPTEADDFELSLKGEFSGIGAEIGMKDQELQIIAPLPDSPAEKAGVRARDLILKINDEESLYMPVGEAVMKIRGEKGTEVTLTLGRVSTTVDGEIIEPIEKKIVRDSIIVKSAKLIDEGEGIYRIEMRAFNEDAADTFRELVTEALQKNPKGIIIDVRNNPGGFLDRAIDIAGEWLKGKVVVQQRKQGEITEKFYGTGRGRLQDIPTVVLINEGSASASEILAGALQDYDIAEVVGVKSFGKGSVQDYIEYEDGSAIKITISDWLTPNGRSIDEEGIIPDVEIIQTTEDYNADRDPQLDRAIEILKKR